MIFSDHNTVMLDGDGPVVESVEYCASCEQWSMGIEDSSRAHATYVCTDCGASARLTIEIKPLTSGRESYKSTLDISQ
ncbi:hypothetical protein [Pararhizobium sp.]|uniref:hypothetical protein n=1 Tax=Pararhizobium sp. TaxID=1977563 RepID=UPI003D0A7690